MSDLDRSSIKWVTACAASLPGRSNLPEFRSGAALRFPGHGIIISVQPAAPLERVYGFLPLVLNILRTPERQKTIGVSWRTYTPFLLTYSRFWFFGGSRLGLCYVPPLAQNALLFLSK